MKYALIILAVVGYVAWFVWELVTAPEDPEDEKK